MFSKLKYERRINLIEKHFYHNQLTFEFLFDKIIAKQKITDRNTFQSVTIFHQEITLM